MASHGIILEDSGRGLNGDVLLAIAGGFLSGNPGAGFAPAAAISAKQRQFDLERGDTLRTQKALYESALKAGANPAQALAYARAPTETLALTPKPIESGTDIFGGKRFSTYTPFSGQLKPMTIGENTAGGASGGIPPTMLAQGVKEYNPALTGEDYMSQFGPELQSAAKAYIAGDVMPTGNPRLQGVANAAKVIAQKYGADIGLPVSDALYNEKRKYRLELGSNSPTTAGGQAKAFTQAVEHADTLSTKLEGLKNWNAGGIPILASTANTVREATSTTQKGLANEVRAIGQTLAGEVGKLFSGSQGGGVREREMTRERFSSVASPPQLAGALEGTIETMEGGLRALESRRDQILGPNNNVTFNTEETRNKIAHIREVIARLKGNAPESGEQPARFTTHNGRGYGDRSRRKIEFSKEES